MIKLRCPECGHKQTLASKRTGKLFCRVCGYEGKREEFIEKEESKKGVN